MFLCVPGYLSCFSACVFFWLRFRNLIVLRQKHDHVACGGGKSTAELGLQETQKNTFLTHTRFLVQKACNIRVSWSFFRFHADTHARSHVLLEKHAESLDVLRWSESRWKHILNTYAFTISLLDFVWKHNRIHHLFWNEIEKHMRVLMLFVLTNRKHLRVLSIFHAFSYAVCLCSCPSVINFRREKKHKICNPATLVSRRQHLVQLPRFWPWSASLEHKTGETRTNHSFANKKRLSLLTLFYLFLEHLLSHVISCYL